MENRKNTSKITSRKFYSDDAFNSAMEREIRALEIKAELEDNPRKKAELREDAARRSRALRKCRSLFSAKKQRISFSCNTLDCGK